MAKSLKKVLAGFVSAAMLAVSVPVTCAAPAAVAASDPNYAEALELSLYFYDANMCGTEITDGPLTWRGDCHTYDAEASFDNATGLSGIAKSVVQAANGGGNTADVSGGYHDAGDHVKFNLTMAFNGASLGWAYYAYPEAFKDTGTEAHLFYIMRRTADYLMKTTYLDDSGNVAAICHTVSDTRDHDIWTAPEVQTYTRPTYWLTSSNNNTRVCFLMSASMAATAYSLKESDPTYAAECLKYADALFKFGSQYGGNETSGMGSMYGTDPSNAPGDKAWAQLWMYLADSSKYSLPTAKPTSNGCYDGSNYDGWIYSWGKVWGGYACLMSKITGDSSYINEVKYNSDRYSNNNEKKYYIIDGWGNSRYNCAWQAYALTYGETANNQAYLDAAKYQMDFILGNNPAGYSYLVGYSDKYPTRIHHRAANPDKGESKYTLYGALIGGASDTSGSITDAVDSYAQTEMALDYNACFTVAIAGMYANYGGDTTAAKSVIAGASEINSDFSYGSEIIVEPIQFKASVSVVDADTGEYIPNVGMRMETKGVGGDVEWNTSDENPKTIHVCDGETGIPFEAIITDMPDGYEDPKDSPHTVTFYTNEIEELVIALKKAEQKVNDNSASFKVYDEETGELVSGAELFLEEYFTGVDGNTTKETVGTWNTSDENPKTFTGLKDSLDDAYVSYYWGISKLPDGYEDAMITGDGDSVSAPLNRSFGFEYGTSEKDLIIYVPLRKAAEPTTGESLLYGDADESGEVNINDVVAIMCYAASEGSNPLPSDKAYLQADVYNNGDGVNASDAVSVQKLLAKTVSVLPESYVAPASQD